MDTTVDSYLSHHIKAHFTYCTEAVFSKDSRAITEEDREKLVSAINSSPHTNILITHGTFTMRESAEYIKEHYTSVKLVEPPDIF